LRRNKIFLKNNTIFEIIHFYARHVTAFFACFECNFKDYKIIFLKNAQSNFLRNNTIFETILSYARHATAFFCIF